MRFWERDDDEEGDGEIQAERGADDHQRAQTAPVATHRHLFEHRRHVQLRARQWRRRNGTDRKKEGTKAPNEPISDLR